MRAAEILVEFYTPEDDFLGKAQMDDSRRPRLTLTHLQKLRKARDIERFDKEKQIQFLPDMYGASSQSAESL